MNPRRVLYLLLMLAQVVAVSAVGLGLHSVGAAAAAAPLKADRIVVLKSKRRLLLMHRGKVVRSYRIGLGFAPKGHKTTEGDGRTPEGHYRIDLRNPTSSYNLSVRISYPNAKDRAQAKARGVSPGGEIFIHGQPNGLPLITRIPGDWTLGCIAVSNREMREIWKVARLGTPVEVRP